MNFASPEVEGQYDSWHVGQRWLLDTLQLAVAIVLSFYTLVCPTYTRAWQTKVPVIAGFITCSGLLVLRLQNSALYRKLRNPGMLSLTLLGQFAMASMPMLYRLMLDEGKSDARVFAAIFLAKLPVFTHQVFVANSLKVSFIPYSSFIGILLLHWGSLMAYDHRLDSNPYMVRVTRTANVILKKLFPFPPMFLHGEGTLGLSSRTLTVTLWIALQSAAFWVSYHLQRRWELQLRAKFIAVSHLPKDTALKKVNPRGWDLLKAHLFFLWLAINGF